VHVRRYSKAGVRERTIFSYDYFSVNKRVAGSFRDAFFGKDK
jgi:hypothetical protein